MSKRGRDLTEKQEKFCTEFLVDFNATQAAIRAGYATNGAKVQASNLLTNINVTAQIKKLQEKAAEKHHISKAWLLTEMQQVYLSMRRDKNEDNPRAAGVALKALDNISKLLGLYAEPDTGNKHIVALQINVKDNPNE